MDIFGIGPLEAILFVFIMLIVLGPADMVKAGRTLGINLRKLWTSPTWRMIFTASDTLRKLPTTLVRETGVEELRQELQRETDTIKKMGKEMNEMAQFNLPKISSPKPSTSTSTSTQEQGDFTAWTTPVEPTSAPEFEQPNSIHPPHLGTPHPSQPSSQAEGEIPPTDETSSETQ